MLTLPRTLVLAALPEFVVGILLVLIFATGVMHLLPAVFVLNPGEQVWSDPLQLVLPVLTLVLAVSPYIIRIMRATMLEVADQDFVKTARAKGVPEGQVVRRHILRNALLPVITFAGIQAGQLIGGSILVETVFAWPGIGRLAFDALLARDYAVLLGVFFCTSVMVVGFNLVTDLLYAVVDPRVYVRSGRTAVAAEAARMLHLFGSV